MSFNGVRVYESDEFDCGTIGDVPGIMEHC